MACDSCESGFQNSQSIVVSIQKSGSDALLYVQNQGRNIAAISRILLCYTTESGSGTLYLRPPPRPISWTYPSATLEQGITALFYRLGASNVTTVQAQAEYVEVDGRSRSCTEDF